MERFISPVAGLETIYDDVVGQRERYRRAIAAFLSVCGPGQVQAFRAPGRVNLIGEHTDYNQGYVFPLALDRDTVLIARPRRDGILRLANIEMGYPPFEFALGKEIPPAPRGDWSNYARGPAQLLARRAVELGLETPLIGFDALISGSPPFGVPRGAGVSSSSALTVVVAVALATLNSWHPAGAVLARFCAEAEWYSGTRGGIMDHFIGILGRRDHAMFLDCRPQAEGHYLTEHLPLPDGYRLVVVDSGVHHQNARGEFNLRVAACRAGVALLSESYPDITHLRDVQDAPWSALAGRLPDEITVAALEAAGHRLGDLPGLEPGVRLKVRARCRHVVTENTRVLEAVSALETGDAARMGRLMNAAHVSARDDYEVSCPELEALVRAASEVDGVAGARLTGAGWGGCVIALVREEATPEFERHVHRRYEREVGLTPTISVSRAGPGAGPVALDV